MGIENFFNTLERTKIVKKKYISEIELEADYLYIDFNSVIHSIVDEFEEDINYYLYSIIISNTDNKTYEIENKYEIHITELNEFINYFSQSRVDELIKEHVYKFIKTLCRNIKNRDNLRELYISFDGTPTFSKIAEQRKRKYMSYIISELKNDIYNRNKDTIDESKKIFYKHKISFGINKTDKYCGNWTGHIQEIYNNMCSHQFKTEIHELCPELKSFIISSAYEFGEGEKKIMEHILHNKKSGKYVIFSPDSDTILLSIIMQNKMKRININTEFNVLKYDTEKKTMEYISIDDITDNLFEMVLMRLNSHRKINHDKLNIIDDIVCIFTFFGNDFLPKIESLNIRNGIEILIDIYVKNFNYCRAKYPYMLFNENNITRMNMNVYGEYIKKLSEFEDKILFDKYMSTEFKNFNYLSNVFGHNEYTSFFIDKLNRYCHGFNKVVRHIKINHNKTAEEIYGDIIEKFTDKDDWIKYFLLIENKDKQHGDISVIELLNIMIKNTRENIRYKLGLKLVKNSDNILDRFHQVNILADRIHPSMNINTYDIEIYKLDKRLDSYKYMSTEPNEKIGIVDMKYKDNEYKIHTDRNMTTKKDYFYSTIMKVENKEKKDKFIMDYVRGFFWVMDFYFNKVNRNVNINNISTWSFEYTHSPYFREISNFIQNLQNSYYELNKIYKSVSEIDGGNYVSPSQYMNALEQYIYVTPKHILKNNIPEAYKEILDDFNLFTDLDDFYMKIKNGDTNILESYDAKNINKTNITGFRKLPFPMFMEEIISMRKFNDIKDLNLMI